MRLWECSPNGQGLAAFMAVKIADGFNLAEMIIVNRTHTLIECMRLGFVEALRWVTDPNDFDIPYNQLYSKYYLQSRREMIHKDQSIPHLSTDIQPMGDDTVYMSAIDEERNACSFINSLFMGGGTGLVVPGTGVFLQNRTSLFSLNPMHPNVVKGGKRPYHTIIPGTMTKNGDLHASFGIMGGFMQPQAHLQILSYLEDLGHKPQQALDMPRFYVNEDGGKDVGANDPGGEIYLDKGFSFDQMSALRRMGHRVWRVSGQQREIFGGGQIILRDPDTRVLIAGSDPRKDGCAMGW